MSKENKNIEKEEKSTVISEASEKKEQQKKEKEIKPPRGRYWGGITYIDSFSKFWGCEPTAEACRQKLVSECLRRGVPVVISPFHDMDKKEKSDDFKKGHFHNMFDCTKYLREASVIFLLQDLCANNKFERINSPLAYYRYMTHEDNPEKFHYEEEPLSVNFDLKFLQGDKDDNLFIILNLIYDAEITSYSSLVHYLLKTNRKRLLKDVVSRSYFYTKLIDSYTYDLQRNINYYTEHDNIERTQSEEFKEACLEEDSENFFKGFDLI